MPIQAFLGSSMTLSEIAAAAQFQTITRDTSSAPEPVITLKDAKDATPQWLSRAVYDSHSEMLPDDWKVRTSRDACEAIAAGEGYKDMERAAQAFADDADAYTAALLPWLTSHPERPGYCDDAQRDRPLGKTAINEIIRPGQALERREALHTILTAIEDGRSSEK